MITIKGINENKELEYELVGGKSQYANQLIITDTTDKKVIYDKTINTFVTNHKIPNDLLENGKTYKLLLLCLDEDNNFIEEADYYYIPTNFKPVMKLQTEKENGTIKIDKYVKEILGKIDNDEDVVYIDGTWVNTKEIDMSTIDMDRINECFKNINNARENFKNRKTRGFEFVSMDQGLKDFDEANILDCDLKLPKRGTSKSAGYDIFAPYEITLQPNQEIKVPTGLKAYMQDGEVLMAFPRSGLGFTYYCRLANTVGVIDSDYYNNPKNEGHMFVKLRNEGTKEMTIKQGDGMCQMIFMPFLLADNDSFNEGTSREGGFGSTTK